MMMRRRVHNPGQLNTEELKASFVVRQEALEEMLRLLAAQTAGHPCQHMILVGARGMGKTTLGLRFLEAVREEPGLASRWQPVPFHEESYEVGDLADFWLVALDHLARATGITRWSERAESLRGDADPKRAAAYALASLLDFCRESGKRLILFVENLDLIIAQIRNERDVHELRAILMEHPEILLVGSANAVFDAISSQGQPFYEFFRLLNLDGLDRGDCRRLFGAMADVDAIAPPGTDDADEGRLETIRRLTGGNPRLMVLACRLLIESPAGSAFEDLERLIDEQTPYFKARIESLPAQARKVFHCLAETWAPMLTKEVSAASKLSSSHSSAQLRQLADRGYVREVRLPGEKRTRYEVADRFYNIYYLLRFSRPGRERLARLVDFLHELFGPTRLRGIYGTTLEALHTEAVPTGEVADWVVVLAAYVARDEEYEGRVAWRVSATDLIFKKVGKHSDALDELESRFGIPNRSRPGSADAVAGVKNALAGDMNKAEASLLLATRANPGEPMPWGALGAALAQQGKNEDALAAFARGRDCLASDDTLGSRLATFSVLVGEASLLLNMDRVEAAVALLDRILDLVRLGDPPPVVERGAKILLGLAESLAKTSRQDRAIEVYSRMSEFARSEHLELRRMSVKALFAKGAVSLQSHRLDEALAAWQQVTAHIHSDDSDELRQHAVAALGRAAFVLSELNRARDAHSALERIRDYVQSDDDSAMRRAAGEVLSGVASSFSVFGRYEEAEFACRLASDIDPTDPVAWAVLAEALLKRRSAGSVAEAERCARRAMELDSGDREALHALYEALRRQGKRKEAARLVARAPDAKREVKDRRSWFLTRMMVPWIAAGHAGHVKRVLEVSNLADAMEPLWHAARAELGEDIGPLPAEVIDAVNEIKRQIAVRRRRDGEDASRDVDDEQDNQVCR